jgi:hypothetical protein
MGKKNNSYTASYKLKVMFRGTIRGPCSRKRIRNSGIQRALLEETKEDQDLHKKKSAYFTHPDFSAAKLGKKSAQIMRVNTVALLHMSRSCVWLTRLPSVFCKHFGLDNINFKIVLTSPRGRAKHLRLSPCRICGEQSVTETSFPSILSVHRNPTFNWQQCQYDRLIRNFMLIKSQSKSKTHRKTNKELPAFYDTRRSLQCS